MQVVEEDADKLNAMPAATDAGPGTEKTDAAATVEKQVMLKAPTLRQQAIEAAQKYKCNDPPTGKYLEVYIETFIAKIQNGEYEANRLANIACNQCKLAELGLANPVVLSKDTPKETKPKRHKQETCSFETHGPQRKSSRLANAPTVAYQDTFFDDDDMIQNNKRGKRERKTTVRTFDIEMEKEEKKRQERQERKQAKKKHRAIAQPPAQAAASSSQIYHLEIKDVPPQVPLASSFSDDADVDSLFYHYYARIQGRGRAVCPICKVDWALNYDGSIRKHQCKAL